MNETLRELDTVATFTVFEHTYRIVRTPDPIVCTDGGYAQWVIDQRRRVVFVAQCLSDATLRWLLPRVTAQAWSEMWVHRDLCAAADTRVPRESLPDAQHRRYWRDFYHAVWTIMSEPEGRRAA